MSENYNILEINETWAIRVLGLAFLEKHTSLIIKGNIARYTIKGPRNIAQALRNSSILSTLVSGALRIALCDLINILSTKKDS